MNDVQIISQLKYYAVILITGISIIFLSSCATPVQPHMPPTPLISSDSDKVVEVRLTSQNVQGNVAWALDKELCAFVSGNVYFSDMRGFGGDAAIGSWWSGGVGRAEVYLGGGFAQSHTSGVDNPNTYNLLSGFVQGNVALSTVRSSSIQAQLGLSCRLSYTSLLSATYYNPADPTKQPDKRVTHQITSLFLRLGYKPVAIDVGSAIMSPLMQSNLLDKPYFLVYIGCAVQL